MQAHLNRAAKMNRKKKIKQTLIKKDKKKKAKLNPGKKPGYISKAEREKSIEPQQEGKEGLEPVTTEEEQTSK